MTKATARRFRDNAKLGLTADDWEWAARAELGKSAFERLQWLVRQRARERQEEADKDD